MGDMGYKQFQIEVWNFVWTHEKEQKALFSQLLSAQFKWYSQLKLELRCGVIGGHVSSKRGAKNRDE